MDVMVTILGVAAGWLLAAFIAAPLIGRRLAGRRREDEAIALANSGQQPPALGPTSTPGPAPGHQHGGLVYLIKRYRCGCIHTWDGTGRLTGAFPCQEQSDLDRWDQEMSGQ